MEQNFHQLNILGVINITPNSFSDANKFNSYATFEKQVHLLLKSNSVIDVGAESTAPFNDPIGSVEELERFEQILFPFLSHNPNLIKKLSIDTYRPEVFYEVALIVKELSPKTKLIFNDVSGKVDDDLVNLLSDESLDFDYVLSHNNAPSRDLTSFHMDYIEDDNVFFENMIEFFKNSLALLAPLGRKVYIDPCFGFSKTLKQNRYLLNHIDQFLTNFNSNVPLLYGISRKSFLRSPVSMDATNPSNQALLDQIQAYFLTKLLINNSDRELLVRTHDTKPAQSALIIAKDLS